MAENPTYGALKIQTLEDLMDAITSIVRIGMAGDPGSTPCIQKRCAEFQ
jgi:CO dehydrogenase/acetyl-CoA synthase delta subunit